MSSRRPRRTVATRPMARRKRRRRTLAALGVTTALVAGVGYGTWVYIVEQEFLLDERCEVSLGDGEQQLSPQQAHNAALLSAEAVNRGLPPQAAYHALGVSLQEADLTEREVAAAEESSSPVLFARGTPSWSEGADAVPVEITVDGFFQTLEESWRAGMEEDEEEDDGEDDEEPNPTWTPGMGLDEVAEVLDRPHNPDFYPPHADRARAFAAPLTGQQPLGMTCQLSQREAPAPDPEAIVEELITTLPAALEIEFTEPPEDASEEEADEFEPEPLIDGIIETAGSGENAEVRISYPVRTDDYDYQWMLAHWSVAVAHDYGIQTVDAGPYVWGRDSGRWERQSDPADSSSITLGFSRE